jgi:Na+(H+)/acetate symporter ActP
MSYVSFQWWLVDGWTTRRSYSVLLYTGARDFGTAFLFTRFFLLRFFTARENFKQARSSCGLVALFFNVFYV